MFTLIRKMYFLRKYGTFSYNSEFCFSGAVDIKNVYHLVSSHNSFAEGKINQRKKLKRNNSQFLLIKMTSNQFLSVILSKLQLPPKF